MYNIKKKNKKSNNITVIYIRNFFLFDWTIKICYKLEKIYINYMYHITTVIFETKKIMEEKLNIVFFV